MTDLLILLSFVCFMLFGVLAPFLLSLAYVWIDTFYPQFVGNGLLGNVPVAFIAGGAAFASYLLMDRRAPPRVTLLLVLYLLLAGWITLTSTWAIVPDAAWFKWNVSVKTVLFCAFIPFVFRSRVQIEALIQVIVFSAAAHILPWGIKTVLTGGGYGQSLGLLSSNAMPLSESSVISAVCFMFVPIFVTLSRHNTLIPPSLASRVTFYGLSATYAIGAIGTFARTALVGLAVMAISMWWRAKRKLGFTIIGVLFLGVMALFTSDRWTERVSTIADYQTEGSALTRTLVWRWTWDFAQDHPFGGGFNVFIINRIPIPNPEPGGDPLFVTGRAFHNIYFAVLGEHGYIGIALYFGVLILTLIGLQRTRKLLRMIPEHAWCYEMAGALQIALAVILTCANFVDISFNALLWDLLAVAVCLREYARRVTTVKQTVKERLADPVARAPLRNAVVVRG